MRSTFNQKLSINGLASLKRVQQPHAAMFEVFRVTQVAHTSMSRGRSLLRFGRRMPFTGHEYSQATNPSFGLRPTRRNSITPGSSSSVMISNWSPARRFWRCRTVFGMTRWPLLVNVVFMPATMMLLAHPVKPPAGQPTTHHPPTMNKPKTFPVTSRAGLPCREVKAGVTPRGEARTHLRTSNLKLPADGSGGSFFALPMSWNTGNLSLRRIAPEGVCSAFPVEHAALLPAMPRGMSSSRPEPIGLPSPQTCHPHASRPAEER